MGNIPIFSTITLITELVVTGGVLYAFYKGYTTGKLPKKIVIATLAYEVLVNISYMIYRSGAHDSTAAKAVSSPFRVGLAIFHGSFSLLMFILLLVFMIVAYRKYLDEVNFFRDHKVLTGIFLVMWMTAIISGVLFYFVAYFTNW